MPKTLLKKIRNLSLFAPITQLINEKKERGVYSLYTIEFFLVIFVLYLRRVIWFILEACNKMSHIFGLFLIII